MTIRLYIDEDAQRRALVRALRSRNVDVITAHEAGLTAVPDERHLEQSSEMGRVLFGFNAQPARVLEPLVLGAVLAGPAQSP